MVSVHEEDAASAILDRKHKRLQQRHTVLQVVPSIPACASSNGVPQKPPQCNQMSSTRDLFAAAAHLAAFMPGFRIPGALTGFTI